MTDAEFAELLASARQGAQLRRGAAVPGARAWRVAAGVDPVEVPVADVVAVAARVHAATSGGLVTPRCGAA